MKPVDPKKKPRRPAPMTSEWVRKSKRGGSSGASGPTSSGTGWQRRAEFMGRKLQAQLQGADINRLGAMKQFPRLHLTVGGLLLAVLLLIVALPQDQPPADRAVRQALVIEPRQPSIAPPPDIAPALLQLSEEPLVPALEDELAPPSSPEPVLSTTEYTEVEQTVRSGDSLSTIFRRAGLNDRAMLEVVNSSPEGKKLARLYPGHQFIFHLDDNSLLQALIHVVGPLNRSVFQRGEAGFEYQAYAREPEIELVVRSGTIKSSLYHAGISAGLTDQLIMQMAAIFGWDVDFALDIRAGDSFQILYEQTYLDGEQIGTGRVMAAEFVNRNSSFKAVRYVNPEGEAQYFTPTGDAMRKAFLRAPLDFRRISSNFNPRRLHPITNTVRPHRGIDYAADRGTPVWASGDGRVIASAYNNANGHYVVIQHGSNIQTKYLHLNRRNVRNGQRVRQKQVIGTVGSTGMSTAPHLHYEFLIDGVHRNPRTIVQQLPKAESIPKDELPRFHAQTQPLLAELESTTRMAASDANEDKNPQL